MLDSAFSAKLDEGEQQRIDVPGEVLDDGDLFDTCSRRMLEASYFPFARSNQPPVAAAGGSVMVRGSGGGDTLGRTTSQGVESMNEANKAARKRRIFSSPV